MKVSFFSKHSLSLSRAIKGMTLDFLVGLSGLCDCMRVCHQCVLLAEGGRVSGLSVCMHTCVCMYVFVNACPWYLQEDAG